MQTFQMTISFDTTDRETAEKVFDAMRSRLPLESGTIENWSTLQLEVANGQRLEPVRMCT